MNLLQKVGILIVSIIILIMTIAVVSAESHPCPDCNNDFDDGGDEYGDGGGDEYGDSGGSSGGDDSPGHPCGTSHDEDCAGGSSGSGSGSTGGGIDDDSGSSGDGSANGGSSGGGSTDIGNVDQGGDEDKGSENVVGPVEPRPCGSGQIQVCHDDCSCRCESDSYSGPNSRGQCQDQSTNSPPDAGDDDDEFKIPEPDYRLRDPGEDIELIEEPRDFVEDWNPEQDEIISELRRELDEIKNIPLDKETKKRIKDFEKKISKLESGKLSMENFEIEILPIIKTIQKGIIIGVADQVLNDLELSREEIVLFKQKIEGELDGIEDLPEDLQVILRDHIKKRLDEAEKALDNVESDLENAKNSQDLQNGDLKDIEGILNDKKPLDVQDETTEDIDIDNINVPDEDDLELILISDKFSRKVDSFEPGDYSFPLKGGGSTSSSLQIKVARGGKLDVSYKDNFNAGPEEIVEITVEGEFYVIRSEIDGRLFGFIPINVPISRTIDLENQVVINDIRPWWSFLLFA